MHSDPRPIENFDGRPQVVDPVRYQVGTEPKQSHFRLFADTDGAVFRIGVGGPDTMPEPELEAMCTEALATWRRLDDVGPVPTAAGKPWWKVW